MYYYFQTIKYDLCLKKDGMPIAFKLICNAYLTIKTLKNIEYQKRF